VTTPTWLVLAAALGGGIVGALISGALLILNNLLQAKRDNDLRKNEFEKQVRIEVLDRIKTAIDEGLSLSHRVSMISSGHPSSEEDIAAVTHYGVAIDGARIAATAFGSEPLLDNINKLTMIIADITGTIIDNSDAGEHSRKILPIIFEIEKQYIELKLKL